VNEVDDGRQYSGVGIGLDAMSKIKNVAMMTGVVGENLLCATKSNVGSCQDESGVKISLHDGLCAKALSGICNSCPPIKTNNCIADRIH
jgi:hypothetical protein